jgi:hypothetical protein
MAYPWMITFDDLTDELIRKRGDDYLTAHPTADKNYYDLTSEKFIALAASFNISVDVLNSLSRAPNAPNPPHYLVIQWLINCLQMLVCRNNVGINNPSMGVMDDIYQVKYKTYNADLMIVQSQLRYETIVSGVIQQNYTRQGGTFRIMA